jgi:mannose-6-phosphate isomerase-like protein (cupin superfamily)
MADTVPGYALEPDAGERLEFGAGTVIIRASGETTNGAFCVFEELPPLLDTPAHVHSNEDELYHVLEGEHVFHCGEQDFHVGPGSAVFLPRGVPHRHSRVVPGEGRLLGLTSPAGLEGFFRGLADADRAGELGPEAFATVSQKYGITWLD